jgi:NAD(P)-dependent dehydrogenase (short-subunit alcohol dehydrogenase family)
VLRTNTLGTFNCIRLAATAMGRTEPVNTDGERGAIVTLASIAAFDGQIGQAAYSASKGGIVGMTLPVARDLSSIGVRLNCVAPGLIDTPIYDHVPNPAEFKENLRRDTLFPKRLGTSDELASLVLELLSNSYANGEVVRLDAGARLGPK